MSIRQATVRDVPQMVDLSEQKRTQYQTFQPLFWRKAHDSRAQQIPFFENQLTHEDIVALVHVALVHEEAGQLDGFVIASLRGGRECSIDDFALADEGAWETVGAELLRVVGEAARARGIERYVVVCGHLDQPKRAMLQHFGLTLDRYWYTAAIDSARDVDSAEQVRAAAPADSQQMAQIAGQPERGYPELERESSIVLVYEEDEYILGYTSAIVVSTPPVYDPGGSTALVLESIVANPVQWDTVGQALLKSVAGEAANRDAVQYVVICDASDPPKQQALQALGLTIASEWYVGEI